MPTKTASKAAGSNGGSLIRDEKLKQLYSSMLKCRMLAESLAAQAGRFPAGFAAAGQEAVLAGCAIDLRAGDTIAASPDDVLAHRILPHLLPPAAKGKSPAFATGEQLDLETGAAEASQRKKNGGIVLAFRGEGALSASAWRKAFTLACAHRLPIVFAVRTHSGEEPGKRKGRRPGAEEIRLQAESCGIPGIPVDGNDAVAVYRVAFEAIARARRGGGPTLMECRTCQEINQRGTNQMSSDPIQHMERYLTQKSLFRPAWKKQLAQKFYREQDIALAGREN